MKVEEMAGRGAVVTGSGSGMGRSIALTLADVGVHVVVADIDPEAAQSVSDEVRSRGVESISFRVDVSKQEEVEALADAAYDAFGDIAVLANNAGVAWRPFRASWDASDSDFHWMMNVNFWGIYHGHRAFVPRMRQSRVPKHIVNTSSIATLQMSSPGASAYTAAKAAVDALSMATRAEYEAAGFGIGVSILYPGFVKTRISTSERLRPKVEQSSQREIIHWETYVGGERAVSGAEGKDTVKDLREVTSYMQPIDPKWVGPMVLRGITQNRPFILTHPTPAAVQDRAAELDRSYEPARDQAMTVR